MRVRGEEGGKQMRGCFVFSGDIRRRHGWCIPWCFSSGLCQPQWKKWEGGGGRIGDGTGRMSSSNIIKKRNGRTVKAVTDSGEWRQVWEWGRTGGRRHALGKHMNQGRERGGGDRTFFFCFLSLPAWDFEVDRRQERKRCLPTACHASAGTPLQAKTKRARLTMFMFSLLAKVDFNRNTVSTINTPPPLCPIPYSCSAPLYRPVQTRGVFERQQWPSLLSCCVNIWEELMNKRMIGQTASVSAKAQTPLPPAFLCAKRWNKKRRAKDNERAWEEIALLQL